MRIVDPSKRHKGGWEWGFLQNYPKSEGFDVLLCAKGSFSKDPPSKMYPKSDKFCNI